MSEKSIPLSIEQAYAQLRSILLKNECRITDEKPHQYVSVKQGSLCGILPKSARKTVEYYLSSEGTGTKITYSTKIDSDWTNLAICGNVLAAVLTGIFMWIAVDMENYVLVAKPGFWTWLVGAYGYPDLQYAAFMINVTKATAIFLALIIATEILIVVYVYSRKNAFAQEILQALHREKELACGHALAGQDVTTKTQTL